MIAYTSDFIPRMVYKYVYSPDYTLSGYIDHSLSRKYLVFSSIFSQYNIHNTGVNLNVIFSIFLVRLIKKIFFQYLTHQTIVKNGVQMRMKLTLQRVHIGGTEIPQITLTLMVCLPTIGTYSPLDLHLLLFLR